MGLGGGTSDISVTAASAYSRRAGGHLPGEGGSVRVRTVCTVAITLAVAACSGSGRGATGPDPSAQPPATTAPAGTTAPSGPPAGGGRPSAGCTPATHGTLAPDPT